MARARAYRHDMKCPHCGCNWLPKDGRSRGKQTYRCRDCNYRFTPDGNRQYYSEQFKRDAVAMYQEAGSIAAVARAKGVSPSGVLKWVKKSPLGVGGDEGQA